MNNTVAAKTNFHPPGVWLDPVSEHSIGTRKREFSGKYADFDLFFEVKLCHGMRFAMLVTMQIAEWRRECIEYASCSLSRGRKKVAKGGF